MTDALLFLSHVFTKSVNKLCPIWESDVSSGTGQSMSWNIVLPKGHCCYFCLT